MTRRYAIIYRDSNGQAQAEVTPLLVHAKKVAQDMSIKHENALITSNDTSFRCRWYQSGREH